MIESKNIYIHLKHFFDNEAFGILFELSQMEIQFKKS